MSSMSQDAARAMSEQRSVPILSESPSCIAATRAPRLAIAAITPAIEQGRFAVKRIVGEQVSVEADVICDGTDKLVAMLLWRAADTPDWVMVPMAPIGNDRWQASFPLQRTGRHVFTVEAWIDGFSTFQDRLRKLSAAGKPLDLELQEGCELVDALASKTPTPESRALADRLRQADPIRRLELLLSDRTSDVMAKVDAKAFHVRQGTSFVVEAERRAAGFASWYELFPRSQSGTPDRHGTFLDVIGRLPAIRDMGFDVLYFPPIHPIGMTNRKGRNNRLVAESGDPGSPYAIGSAEGGHDALLPELGTFADWRELCAAAKAHGIEIALDFAIQCSPDHPWIREHPEWFAWRADGTIRHAENPPKTYEDIVNVAFYRDGAKPSLWLALRDIVLFWVGEGVRTFRVDNPHTKPLPFWEWLIADIRSQHPDVIFLAEAFTNPKMMYQLGKVGYSQSYTYFTWRNTPAEIRDYLTELNTPELREFFRPNFFVNTPDINPAFLQESGRAGFLLRAVLAATLSGLWGVYNGFELCEGRALEGGEEYADSEKYQLRQWDYDRPGNIVAEIQRLNEIRRSNPALQTHLGVTFLDCSNDQILCYVKATDNQDNVILVVASFDPFQPQSGEVDLQADALGAGAGAGFLMEDLMLDKAEQRQNGLYRFTFDPTGLPFGIWQISPADEA